MNIGKSMKELREARNIPRTVMAEELGITRTALWKVESGKCVPKQKTVDMFCHKMQIPPAYLYNLSIEESDYKLI